MTRRRATTCVTALALLVTSLLASPALAAPGEDAGASGDAASPAGEAALESVLERLRVAVEAHPADADLAWIYARKLAETGRKAEAVERTRSFVSRWPDRRPGARVEVARRLLEVDGVPEALALLDEEIAARPRSGTARFYRGLAFRREGKLPAADREFQLAARLEPALRPESLMARALGLFDMGREEEAVGLLVEVLQLDPTGDTAVRARLMLRQRELGPSTSPLRADAYAGFEWDDNVTLESAENETPASERQDFRGIWGVGLSGRLAPSESTLLSLGYRFDQSEYADLDSFSLLSNTLFAGAQWRAGERLALRLDAVVNNALQDLDNELTGGSIRPSAVYSLGADWGALRVFSGFEVAEYDDRPTFAAWERDSLGVSVGLEHFLPLRMEGSWLSLSGSWQRTLTQAEPSGGSDGFDGDYDYDSLRARALAELALPFFEMRARIEGSYTYDRYHNENLAHFIVTGGTRQREDDVLMARIGLSGPIVGPVRLEAYWRATRRISNVDAFDYDKQIVGLVVRVATD